MDRLVRDHRESSNSRYIEDIQLVRDCLRGDQDAWRNLVERYARLVYSVALHVGLSNQDVAEVSQNVFTTLFCKLSTLRDERCLASWLITTTRHESQRLSKSYGYTTPVDDLADEKAIIEDQITVWEQQQFVREAVKLLDPQSRNLLTALFLDESNPDYQEIAQRLGIPLGSIGPMRARAFKKLEEILREMKYDKGA